MNGEKIKLEEYTKKLSENIYDTIASICILRTIEEVAKKVNEDGHGSYYSYIQKQMINSSILSLNKIFDNSKQSVTIKKINNHIEYQHRKIPIKEHILSTKANDFRYFCIENLKAISNTNELANYLSSELTKIEEIYKSDLNALRELRDRHLAHTDLATIENKTTWDKVDKLIEFLLDYLDLIDFMLLASIWSGDGEKTCSTLVSNAKKAGLSLARTFQKLGYIKDLDEIEAIK